MTDMTKETALMRTLDAALSLRRPHGSAETAELVQWLMNNLPEHLSCSLDAAGNLHVDARQTAGNRTLFIAHVDTVHRTGGDNKIIKDEAKGMWRAGMKDQCLGADDGGGVAMLMHLMWHGIPAYYIFSQGEECGGIGAKFLAQHHDATLLEFDRAIAFDRKGIDSVITHQAYGRCCSDAFATALAMALNTASNEMLFLAPDDTGIYTDTAEFVDLIPECTNISIGYDHAHGDKESIDVSYVRMLADAVVQIYWDNLPTDRDPSVADVEDYGGVYGWENWRDQWATQHSSKTEPSTKQGKGKGKGKREYSYEMEMWDALDDAMYGRFTALVNMIAEVVYPEDPSIAKKQINTRLLTDEVLYWAEDQLYNNANVCDVLEALFEGAQVH